jgi:hypothetical protein
MAQYKSRIHPQSVALCAILVVNVIMRKICSKGQTQVLVTGHSLLTFHLSVESAYMRLPLDFWVQHPERCSKTSFMQDTKILKPTAFQLHASFLLLIFHGPLGRILGQLPQHSEPVPRHRGSCLRRPLLFKPTDSSHSTHRQP